MSMSGEAKENSEFVQLDMTDDKLEEKFEDNDTNPEDKSTGLTISESTVESCNEPLTDPRWLGNCMAFCYINHNPLFTIGPHCIAANCATYRGVLFGNEWVRYFLVDCVLGPYYLEGDRDWHDGWSCASCYSNCRILLDCDHKPRNSR